MYILYRRDPRYARRPPRRSLRSPTPPCRSLRSPTSPHRSLRSPPPPPLGPSWRSDPGLWPQIASDGLGRWIWGHALKRPRRSDWGRGLERPQVGPWSMKKWSSFKLAKITNFAIFGLGWPRRSDLRSPGPPKSRSLSNFWLQSWPPKTLPSMIFWHPK